MGDALVMIQALIGLASLVVAILSYKRGGPPKGGPKTKDEDQPPTGRRPPHGVGIPTVAEHSPFSTWSSPAPSSANPLSPGSFGVLRWAVGQRGAPARLYEPTYAYIYISIGGALSMTCVRRQARCGSRPRPPNAGNVVARTIACAPRATSPSAPFLRHRNPHHRLRTTGRTVARAMPPAPSLAHRQRHPSSVHDSPCRRSHRFASPPSQRARNRWEIFPPNPSFPLAIGASGTYYIYAHQAGSDTTYCV